jgi:hypothetical protein
MLVMPERPWRIITSEKHSTVWDGGDLIFDFNFQAFGIDPNECFADAADNELPPGKYLRVYFAEHYSVDQRRLIRRARLKDRWRKQHNGIRAA